MKRMLIAFVGLIVIITSNVLALEKGAIELVSGAFYFDGFSIYQWSGYKPENKLNNNAIYKYIIEKKEKKLFYSGECFLGDITISPNRSYLGARCFTEKKPISLIVLNMKGERILELSESVHEYVWYPDENKIVYMTGAKTYRGDETIIIPDGVWFYDIKEKKKIKIAEKGWSLRRMGFDRHIYFWNGEKTVRYNVDTKKIEDTAIKEKVNGSSISYSPNGRYYVYSLNGELDSAWEEPYWSPFRIFDTKENQNMSPEKVGFLSERNPVVTVWGKDSRQIAFQGNVARTNYEQMTYIYDIEANQLIKRFKGEIVGYDEDRTVLVIYRDGDFFIEKIPFAKDMR